jgi:hypothetical protein
MADNNDAPAQPSLLGDLVSDVLRRALQRSRTELGRAARSGRLQLELRQARRDLDHFWQRLGKTSYNLTESGEIDHPALRRAMTRIDELEERIDALRSGEANLE